MVILDLLDIHVAVVVPDGVHYFLVILILLGGLEQFLEAAIRPGYVVEAVNILSNYEVLSWGFVVIEYVGGRSTRESVGDHVIFTSRVFDLKTQVCNFFAEVVDPCVVHIFEVHVKHCFRGLCSVRIVNPL